MVTAVAFTPDARMVVAGLYHGQVFFYQYENLRYYTQIECKNKHGFNRSGKKVTGLSFYTTSLHNTSGKYSSTSMHDMPTSPPSGASREGLSRGVSSSDSSITYILVTTNDSRIRVFKLDDYSLVSKYKGLKNDRMQIKASFSDDGKYIISGSEDGNTIIWNRMLSSTSTDSTSNSSLSTSTKKWHEKSYESFQCNGTSKTGSVNTVAIFSPVSAVLTAMEAHPAYSSIGLLDVESKIIVTSDYLGCIKIFQRGEFPEKNSE